MFYRSLSPNPETVWLYHVTFRPYPKKKKTRKIGNFRSSMNFVNAKLLFSMLSELLSLNPTDQTPLVRFLAYRKLKARRKSVNTVNNIIQITIVRTRISHVPALRDYVIPQWYQLMHAFLSSWECFSWFGTKWEIIGSNWSQIRTQRPPKYRIWPLCIGKLMFDLKLSICHVFFEVRDKVWRHITTMTPNSDSATSET